MKPSHVLSGQRLGGFQDRLVPSEGKSSVLQRLLSQTVQHEADELTGARLQLGGREVHLHALMDTESSKLLQIGNKNKPEPIIFKTRHLNLLDLRRL